MGLPLPDFCFENVVLDYHLAAGRGATRGQTVTFYLGGVARPVFHRWLSTTSEALATGTPAMH